MRRQRKARLPDVSPPRLLVTDVNLCVCVRVDTMFRCLSEDQNWNVTVLVGTRCHTHTHTHSKSLSLCSFQVRQHHSVCTWLGGAGLCHQLLGRLQSFQQ